MSRGRQGQLGCAIAGCGLKIRSGGFCSKHLREARDRGETVADLRLGENRPPLARVACHVDGCDREARYRGQGQALCSVHYQRRMHLGTFELPKRPTRREYLEAGIGPRDGCWLWAGAIADTGYGRIGAEYAHRVSYEEFVGPIPEGLQIDHLCRNRPCVNPDHLEAVTQRENLRREADANWQTCKRGHSLDDAMLARRSDGRVTRRCRTCHQDLRAARKAVAA